MQEQYSNLTTVTRQDGSVSIVADEPCEVVVNQLSEISFELENSRLTIKPEGFTYERENLCHIALQKIHGNIKYLLGSVFL